MAKLTKTALATRHLMVDAGLARCNGGKVRIYDGTRPTDADTAVGAQVLLAEPAYSATAYGPAATSGSNSVATANAITADSAADATGTATWARHVTSAGVAVFDSNVGDSSDAPTDIQMNNKSIQIGANVSITSLTYTLPPS